MSMFSVRNLETALPVFRTLLKNLRTAGAECLFASLKNTAAVHPQAMPNSKVWNGSGLGKVVADTIGKTMSTIGTVDSTFDTTAAARVISTNIPFSNIKAKLLKSSLKARMS